MRVHPIAAVQTEYSLWTRNPEVAVLDTCRELGITVVAFSPLARGFLTGRLRGISHAAAQGHPAQHAALPAPSTCPHNLSLLDGLSAIADQHGCTMGQVALAWVLARGDHIIPIPGTTNLEHLAENAGAVDVHLSEETMAAWTP